MMDEGKKNVKAYWWCSHCKQEVGGANVTNQEFHDACGYPVEAREIPEKAERGDCYKSEMTIREYFAAMAMQGLCACPVKGTLEGQAPLCVVIADALIAELTKTEVGG